MVVVVVGWVVWVEQNERGSGLGDVDRHVIHVGTCCSNRHDFMWAGGSVVKRALLQLQEVGCLLYFTVPHTFPWSPHGVLMDFA